jgi:predicted dehydrogenase
MPKHTRISIVGCGSMAETHALALAKTPGVEIVSFCDADRECAAAKAASFGGAVYQDVGEMLDACTPDAVYFLLPPFAHGAELEAVSRGIPFFVEKPIGLDPDLTRKIAAAVTRKGLITGAGYMNRYRRSVQMVERLLADDPAILATGGWLGGTPGPHKGAGAIVWWVQKAKSGGQLHEQVTHTVDLARFFCGDAVEVHAFGAAGFNTSTTQNYDLEDAVVANVRFASGAVATLQASCSTNTGGGIHLNVHANHMTALFSGWDHTLRLLRQGKDTVEVSGDGDIFAVEDAAFIKAIRTGDPSHVLSTYPDAANTLAITVATNESLRTGAPARVRNL